MKNFLKGLLGLTILAIIAYFILKIVFFLSSWIYDVFVTLAKSDQLVLVAIITGLISILGVFVSKRFEYHENKRRYLLQQREEGYRKTVNLIYKTVRMSVLSGEVSKDDLLSDIYNISVELTLWGSNNVVEKWSDFRKIAINFEKDNPNQLKMLLSIEKVLYAIRKDFGYRKTKQGRLLSFFINDIDEQLEFLKK